MMIPPTIYNTIKKAATQCIPHESITHEFWVESMAYAQRVLLPLSISGKTNTLNDALGYDRNNDDLIMKSVERLASKYEYFIEKYHLLVDKYDIEFHVIYEFNKIVSTIIPNLLKDLYRSVSTINFTQNNKRILKNTHSTISIDQDTDHLGNKLTLSNYITSTKLTPECFIISRESIMTYLSPLFSMPRELLGFMTMCLDISAKEIEETLHYTSLNEFFNTICNNFAIQYDVPQLLSYINHYSYEQLCPTGLPPTRKDIYRERSLSKFKVKKFIMQSTSNPPFFSA